MQIFNKSNTLKMTGAMFAFLLIVSCAAGVNSSGNSAIMAKKSHQLNHVNNRAHGEYIVTILEGSDKSIIEKCFSSYGLIKIKLIQKYKGKHRYLIKLEKDPGPKEMEGICGKSKGIIHIQPNYIYRTQM